MMSIFVRPNYPGLVSYLDRFGIDANRVTESSVSPEGYDYIAQFPDGRPVYHNGHQLTWDRKEWPSPLVYENVVFLLGGGSLADINIGELIVEDQAKDDDSPHTKPSLEDKLETPAEIKKPVARKRSRK